MGCAALDYAGAPPEDDTALAAKALQVGKAGRPQDHRREGFLSTVTLSVERSYSGSGAAGDTVELRRRSGETSEKKIDSSVEAPLKEGDKVLLIASKAYYANSTGKPQGSVAIELAPLYRVDGSQLTPTAPYQAVASLSEIS